MATVCGCSAAAATESAPRTDSSISDTAARSCRSGSLWAVATRRNSRALRSASATRRLTASSSAVREARRRAASTPW